MQSLPHLLAGLQHANSTPDHAIRLVQQRMESLLQNAGLIPRQQAWKAVNRAIKDEERFLVALLLDIVQVDRDIAQGEQRIGAIVHALGVLTEEQFKRLLRSRSLDDIVIQPTAQPPMVGKESGKDPNVGATFS